MIFEYDKAYQTLKFISDTGMVQAVHILESDLEKLYFMLWSEISESDMEKDCDAMKYSLTSESLGV